MFFDVVVYVQLNYPSMCVTNYSIDRLLSYCLLVSMKRVTIYVTTNHILQVVA